MLRSFLLFAAVLLWAGCAVQAQKAVPEAVKATFNEKFPKADDVEWKLEADGNWEVEFELDDEESSATFSAEGKWLETETEIAKDDLPDAVRKAVQGQKVKEAARILKADGTTVYEVEIGKKDLIYDANGQLLLEEKIEVLATPGAPTQVFECKNMSHPSMLLSKREEHYLFFQVIF